MRVGVAVLVSVENVAAVLRNKTSNAGHNAFAVGTTEKQDGGFLHAMNLEMYTSYRQRFPALTLFSLKASCSADSFEENTFTTAMLFFGQSGSNGKSTLTTAYK